MMVVHLDTMSTTLNQWNSYSEKPQKMFLLQFGEVLLLL